MQSPRRLSEIPHTTRKGVIVYKQPTHHWTAADLSRVGGHVVETAPSDPSWLVQLLDTLNRFLLGKILGRWGLTVFTDVIYRFLVGLVDIFVNGLITPIPPDFLAMAADSIYERVAFYSPRARAISEELARLQSV